MLITMGAGEAHYLKENWNFLKLQQSYTLVYIVKLGLSMDLGRVFGTLMILLYFSVNFLVYFSVNFLVYFSVNLLGYFIFILM